MFDLTGIEGISADSRTVEPGWLFAAIPGARADGQTFIPQAVARGAVAVLAPPGAAVPEGVRLLETADPRRDFALIAAQFHGVQPEAIAAVTGTNGKTSTVQFAQQLWAAQGHKAAALGTLEGAMTTPDPVALHTRLATLAAQGVTHLAMEASSHGLDQCRLDGVRICAAAFTNLTRDHLDYHPDMAAYRAAKLRLFAELLPEDGLAVVNADGPEAQHFARAARGRVVTYGASAGADLRALALTPLPHEQRAEMEVFGRRFALALPLVGAFQASNALAALALASGGEKESAWALAPALAHLSGVPGRMERVGAAPVYVDYAHTPDGLRIALTALRPHCAARLICVFGCGGDRDAGKRPTMGAIAARLADAAIITDDNPRGEDPAAIRAAIRATAPGSLEIGDRREAIRAGVRMLRPGDVLLIAGKGHEAGQTIAGRTYLFNDVEEAKKALEQP
ncbi:MAG TPA: UDP-N-acetylmuramoyl-L-alanyl-D-glutamate--2,6-diaminopimelate ligase [Rhodospirillaceae bacterium]|jgi:UDP-N-acetylmuramoyl-L-alanyl-D-glutamate--2,6-diaminopimelate ligase|nr:UDP-N-acetylmuramoyl-L-alanyl-D-glutamate--2,6-diaminopimelate ligase [Alphaproteobacteria bacterium]HBH27163.1 UDP-N-acetylmuramoyl-L-alanyl-D-glutamate--2,6-diaminopimelate ligase [Rhodospirillaceae bacterium]